MKRGLLRAAGPTLQPPVDFKHWANCDRLTPSEAAYLLMGKDPDEPGFLFPREQENLNKFNRMLARSQGLFVDGMVSPLALYNWARSGRITVDLDFSEAILLLERAKQEYQTKARQRIACDDNEAKAHILELEERLAEKDRELQALRDETWEGFDPDSEFYPEELDIALQAHRHVSRAGARGPVIARLKAWVKSTYPQHKDNEAMVLRIAKVANWNKKGGRSRNEQ